MKKSIYEQNLIAILSGDLKERFENAKKRAHDIFYGIEGDNDEEDFEIRLRSIISDHYRIPIFCDMFEKMTLEQLIIECELIQLRKMPQEKSISKMIRDTPGGKEEMESLFDDMVEQDQKEMQARNRQKHEEPAKDEWVSADAPSSAEMDKITKEFMESNKFKGEE